MILNPLVIKVSVDVVLVRPILVVGDEVVLKVDTIFVVDLIEEGPPVELLIFAVV